MAQSNVVVLTELVEEQPQERQSELFRNVEALKNYQKAEGIAWAEVARRLDYNAATISQYIKGVYQGDVAKVDRKVDALLTAERQRALAPKVNEIVVTRQVQEVMAAIEFLGSTSFALFVGEAGIGKSRGLKLYAREHIDTTLLITLNPLRNSKHALVKYLYSQLPGKKPDALPSAEKLDEIIRYFKDTRKTILLDEAHWLSMDAYETARTIQDLTDIGIVLSGTFQIADEFGFSDNTPRNAQLYSRVQIYRVITPEVSLEDLSKVLALYGVRDEEIAAWLHGHCNRPGYRYRWATGIVDATLRYCAKRELPINLDAVKKTVKLTQRI